MDNTLNDMAALQALHEIPIAWRDVEQIRDAIEQMKRDQRRQQQQSADDVDRQILAAVLVGEEPAQIATRFNISLTDLHAKIAAADQRWRDSIVSLVLSTDAIGTMLETVSQQFTDVVNLGGLS